MTEASAPFRILSLDGGGAKGVYTLGVLQEVQAITSRPLHEVFSLIYGTSTGAIIAALLALGRDLEEITREYFTTIPEVMSHWWKRERSAALKRHAYRLFGDMRFDAFKTDVGIVAIDPERQRPVIFKSDSRFAFGRKGTFEPGFGATIVDALLASAAAYPAFARHRVTTATGGLPAFTLIDGGFVANNPTLFAIADAAHAGGVPKANIRVLSVGTGSFPDDCPRLSIRRVFQSYPFKLVPAVFSTSSNTLEQLRSILLGEVQCVRVSDTFNQPEYGTNLLETDTEKLKKLYGLGRDSFGRQEKEIRALLTT